MMLNNNIPIIDQVREYIDTFEYGKPILLANVISDFVVNKKETDKVKKTISTYLNRLVKANDLKKLDNGIFYKSKTNIFGEIPIDYTALLNLVYFHDKINDQIIGYRIGTNVLANIGISNNLENTVEIVTNNYNRKKVLYTINQNINLKKPVTKINKSNYLYLQLLDTIKDIEKYHIIDDKIGAKLVNYLNKNEIKVDKLFRYANKYYNKKTLKNLISLLAS